MSKEIYNRVKKNVILILGSRLVFGLLNVATTVIITKFYGLKGLGVLLLLQSYTWIFNVVLKYDTWQAVITYGSKLREKKDDKAYQRLLGLLFSIDVISLTIGVLLAITFAPFAANIFEWPKQVTDFVPIFVLSIYFGANATPIGVLRLHNKMKPIVAKFAIRSIVKFFGVIAAVAMGGNVFHLSVVWFLAVVLAGIWPIVASLRILKASSLRPKFKLNLLKSSKEFPKLWRFLSFANASNFPGFIYRTGTTLFLGSTLGVASAAIFEIAYQFASSIGRPIRLLGPIISPEFANLAAKNDWHTFSKILTKQLKITGGLLLIFGIILMPILKPILEAMYGSKVIEDIWLFRFLLLFFILKVLSFTFEPAILSANKSGTLLIVSSISALLYCLITLSLIETANVTATGIAAVISQIIYVTVLILIGKKLLKKRRRKHKKSP